MGGARDPLAPCMCKGEDCLEGKALPFTVKVKAFGTDLKKNKQTGSCLWLPNSFLQITGVVKWSSLWHILTVA